MTRISKDYLVDFQCRPCNGFGRSLPVCISPERFVSISIESSILKIRLDALSAILTVLSIRGPQMTYVSTLHRTLESLRNEVEDAGALESMISAVNAHTRHRNSAGTEAAIEPDEASAKNWLEKCAIMGNDQQRFLALLCRKPSVVDNEGAEGRSVRTL